MLDYEIVGFIIQFLLLSPALFSAAADAAELMETAPHDVGAWTRLNRALQKAEEIYLSAGETDGDKA